MTALALALQRRAPKRFLEGTHRVVDPAATLARAKPLARAMGITRIGNITGLDYVGIPVAIAVRPMSRTIAVSQGKGLSAPHAMASALMESIEAFHGERIWPGVRRAALKDLSPRLRIDVDQLCGTGMRLPKTTPIPWMEGCDLERREPCWVPAEVVHTGASEAESAGLGYFLAGSNGLASGNHHLEAVSAALCELVERDAIALWESKTLLERASCRIDPETVNDPSCLRLLERYRAAGIAASIWDVTSDIRLPAFVCDIRAREEPSSSLLRRFRGTGCHPSRSIALCRALTEAAQVRLTHIVGIRNDIFEEAYQENMAQTAGGLLLDAVAQTTAPRSFMTVPTFEADDLSADVQHELAQLRAAGLDRVIAIDLTQEAFGIPVVRVVIPGLEGDPSHPLYRPGPRARAAGTPS